MSNYIVKDDRSNRIVCYGDMMGCTQYMYRASIKNESEAEHLWLGKVENLTYSTFETQINALGLLVKHEGDNCLVITTNNAIVVSISKEYTHGVDTRQGYIEGLDKSDADKLLDLSFALAKILPKDREQR